MKITTLTILILIITLSSVSAQFDCEKAIEFAKIDIKKSNFSFHSGEMLPVDNTYFYVLKNYYNIGWYFTDSLAYYACYDSVMINFLRVKYGVGFLQRARIISDSLENTENWRNDASFPGGRTELFKFISSHLSDKSLKIDSLKTKTRIFIQFGIDSTGKVKNPKVMRGINKKVDNKVIQVISQLPDWIPGHLYGKPIEQTYTMPINLNFK